MKILFLSPYFFPDNISTGKWNTAVCDLLRSVSQLKVVCFHPFYPEWKISPTSEIYKGADVVRAGMHLKFPTHLLLRRMVMEFFWLFTVWKNRSALRTSDRTIVIFPPTLAMLAIKSGQPERKLIGVVHDVQSVMSGDQYGLVAKLLGGVISAIELKAFSKCDKLIFLSQDMQEICLKRLGSRAPASTVCYPFVTIDSFSDNGALAKIIPQVIDETNIVYSGAMGVKQHSEPLLEFFKEMSDENPLLKFHVFSGGPMFKRLSREYESDQIKFHALVETDELPELLLRSDVQIVPQAPGTSNGCLPSKLPNILASGSKLLLVTDTGSELESMLEGVPGVEVATSWDSNELRESLLKLVNSPEPTATDRRQILQQFKLQRVVDELVG